MADGVTPVQSPPPQTVAGPSDAEVGAAFDSVVRQLSSGMMMFAVQQMMQRQHSDFIKEIRERD